MAREQLAEEVDIIEIVRSRRLVSHALKMLLTREQHVELLRNAQYTIIEGQDYDDASFDVKKGDARLTGK